jgi:ubiquinone/menaquinone biosynthesis C-methylase UbiE
LASPVQESAFWDKVARKYAASAISDMAGYERTLARVRQLLTPADVVVEFGCGTGTSALRLAPSLQHLLATDYSSAMIEIAREKAAAEGCANVTFAVEAPEQTVQADASFDAALAFNLLHLVKERKAALAQMHRVVRPGGLFISKTPCLSEMNPLIRLAVPVARWLGKAPYVDFFNGAQLEAEVVDAGFEIVERGRHGAGKKDFRLFLVARRV